MYDLVSEEAFALHELQQAVEAVRRPLAEERQREVAARGLAPHARTPRRRRVVQQAEATLEKSTLPAAGPLVAGGRDAPGIVAVVGDEAARELQQILHVPCRRRRRNERPRHTRTQRCTTLYNHALVAGGQEKDGAIGAGHRGGRSEWAQSS